MMEMIKGLKVFMYVGLGTFMAGATLAVLQDNGVIQPKTRQGENNLAIIEGMLSGTGGVLTGLGVGGIILTAEELAKEAIKEVV